MKPFFKQPKIKKEKQKYKAFIMDRFKFCKCKTCGSIIESAQDYTTIFFTVTEFCSRCGKDRKCRVLNTISIKDSELIKNIKKVKNMGKNKEKIKYVSKCSCVICNSIQEITTNYKPVIKTMKFKCNICGRNQTFKIFEGPFEKEKYDQCKQG